MRYQEPVTIFDNQQYPQANQAFVASEKEIGEKIIRRKHKRT
jgi:hypothetical protein